MADTFTNFAKVTVSTGYDASATSIVLTAGHGARLPAVPFNATWWNATDYGDPSDDPNREIVRVTAKATDTLTVTRGQESITATTKNTASKTYRMVAGLTAKTITSDLAATTDVQIFTSGGTWTKPTGAKWVDVICIGAGGGGGSGRKGAAATVRCGGGGGSAGAIAAWRVSAAHLGATETVTVGTAGAGGAAQATTSTDGNDGANGGAVTFGAHLSAAGGAKGLKGTATTGVGGTAPYGFPDLMVAAGLGNGAAASTTGAVGVDAAGNVGPPAGGGGGGGITTGNTAAAGGQGGSVAFPVALPNNYSGYGGNLAGGTAGAVNTAGGAGTARATNATFGGAGGGGGGASTTTNAGAGGVGGAGGGGGGGGGAAVNAVGNSGAGGTGGAGVVIVTTMC